MDAEVDGIRHGPEVDGWARTLLPDALSRLPGSQERGSDIDASFPDDTTEAGSGGEGGSQGPNLDGALLKELEAEYPEENCGCHGTSTRRV